MTKTNPTQISRLTWQALEFEHHEKGPSWFFWLAGLGVLLLAYAAWQRDIFMFLTFLFLLFATFIYARRKPKTMKIELSGRGVHINGDLTSYSQLKSFWIIYEPPAVKILGLETTFYINRELVLQLDDADPNAIREFLLPYLPEDVEREENYSDKLMRKLKF